MHTIFDFQQDYTLEDSCVLLRDLQPDDAHNLRVYAMNEPDLWKYSLLTASGEENLIKYINLAWDARLKGKEYPFIVFDKVTGKYAGSTRFYDIQLASKTLQLGFTWYGKQYQGTGLNKRCKLLLLSFAFEKMGMERVEFRADNTNERSIAAMKSIGCMEEGVLRSHAIKPDGSRRDSIVLSILKPEWGNGVKQKLEVKLKGY